MSVGTKMLEHMRHLIEEGDSTPTRQRPLTVALQEEHTRVEAEVYAFDTLGVSLRGLTVWGNHRDAALEMLAQTISRQVTYLWEPLALIERDIEREEVQMRSAPPRVEDKAIEFYEGWLTRRDGALRFHLVRYRRQNGEPRRTSMQFTLTHEVFRRLVDDLASILQAPEPE